MHAHWHGGDDVDEHVVEPGYAPSPFTAAEIRDGCPDGHQLTIRVTSEAGMSFHTNRFRSGDVDGVIIDAAASDAEGSATGEISSERTTWLQLQAHAAFPEELTSIADAVIDTPIGTLDCLRYTVRLGETTSTFWFALSHPGMPVHWEAGDESATVVAIAEGSLEQVPDADAGAVAADADAGHVPQDALTHPEAAS